MRLLLVVSVLGLATAFPGLKKIPKVYNALITSNQNLSPSRAYPVLQPVIHRTAYNYVPSIYYSQISSQSPPQVINLSPLAKSSLDPARSGKADENYRAVSIPEEKTVDETPSEKAEVAQPLSFYPNYHSLYYDPYFYTYNGYDSHLAPSVYQFDYHSQTKVDPLPPPEAYSPERLLPGLHEEKEQDLYNNLPIPQDAEKVEKIPDVPPPPLPTAFPKSS